MGVIAMPLLAFMMIFGSMHAANELAADPHGEVVSQSVLSVEEGSAPYSPEAAAPGAVEVSVASAAVADELAILLCCVIILTLVVMLARRVLASPTNDSWMPTARVAAIDATRDASPLPRGQVGGLILRR